MSEVVCNTSPIQYLHQAHLLHLLPGLYGQILVPAAVEAEIEAGRHGGIDLPIIGDQPWVAIRAPTRVGPAALGLGAGETEVLMLALELPGSLVILDDAQARRRAASLGLLMTGTLGILLAAKAAGLISAVHPHVEELHALGFRISTLTRDVVLRLAGEQM